VTKILYTKRTPTKKFYIVDGGMSDLIRPSLYEAYHNIMPVKMPESASADPRRRMSSAICESGDFLGHDRLLRALKEARSRGHGRARTAFDVEQL